MRPRRSAARAAKPALAQALAKGDPEAICSALCTAADAGDLDAVLLRLDDPAQRAAVEGLARAAAALQQQVAATTAEVEEHALGLALELTETLVGHELATTSDPVGDVVRRALAVVPQGLPVTVRLAPSVAGEPAVATLREQGVTVVADPALDPHDALVESTVEAVDLRIRAALDRVREVLS